MPFQPYSSRKRARFSNFMDHVREYTSRNLTKQADSLCAFVGILHRFESCSPPINNLFGLPIVSGKAVESFVHALTWIHDRQYNLTPIARRRDFPSYSFVGWRGTASTQAPKGKNNALNDFHVTGVEIQIHGADCGAWNLEDVKKLTNAQGISRSSLQLWIKAPVLPPSIWSKVSKEDLQGGDSLNALNFEVMMQLPSAWVKCKAEVSGMIKDDKFLDGTKRGDMDCLLLGSVAKNRQSSPCYFAMIVKHNAGKDTERMGILSFTVSGPDLEGQILELAKERRGFCFNSFIEL